MATDETPPYAIVIGLDDIRGVHAARTLTKHGVPVIAIARDPKSYGCKTKVCERILYADTRSEEFVSVLEQLGPTLQRRAILVPCLDMAALQVSRHRDRLKAWYPITLPDSDIVEMLMDKVSFYKFAAEAGLPIPKTKYLSSVEDVSHAAEQLQFPCAVKPRNSKDPIWLAYTHVKAMKVANLGELLSVFETWSKITSPLVVQEWIEGGDENLFACHCYIGADSEPLVSFTSRKIRQWPPQTGQASLAQECRDDQVRMITFDLFRRVGFRGLGYVEVKQDSTSGKYFIVEPNIGRVSGRMGIAEAGGVPLLYTMYCDSLGLPLPNDREQRYGNAKWVYLRQDLQSTISSYRHGQITFRQWWRSLRGPKAFALWSWRDPSPFFADILHGIRLILSKSERQKRSETRHQNVEQ